MSMEAEAAALYWGYMEPEFALSDGRHSCWTCHSCGATIEDKGVAADDGSRDREGMAPVDYCRSCRVNTEFYHD